MFAFQGRRILVAVCIVVLAGASASWAIASSGEAGNGASAAAKKKKKSCKKAAKRTSATVAKKKRKKCAKPKPAPSKPGSTPGTPTPPAPPAPTEYALNVAKAGTGLGTVTSNPSGITCGVDCSQDFKSGEAVTLTVEAGPGSVFVGWTGDCSGSDACHLTMDGNKAATAEFAPITYTLSISSNTGTGSGSVSSTPTGIDCPSGACQADFNAGTPVELIPTADPGSSFAGWTGACTGMGQCQVEMDAAKSVGANFDTSFETLTITKDGNGLGRVDSAPAGITCGDTCAADFANGQDVTLTATSFPPSTFTGWSGDCTGMGACVVDMTEARDVTANFSLNTYTLTVIVAGNGTVTAEGINCPGDCTETYTEDTILPLSVHPGPGAVFGGWTGACAGIGDCTLLMNQARTVGATFNPT